VNKVHNTKKRQDFHYKSSIVGSPSQYSDSYVDWLVAQFGKDSGFFSKARLKVRTVEASK